MSREQFIGNLFVLVFCWGAAALALIVGIVSSKISKPMTSITGSKRRIEDIWDVKGFNREVGKIWKYYSIPFWVAGPLWMILPKLGAVIMLLSVIPGLFVVHYFYGRTAKKFSVEEDRKKPSSV